MKGDFWCRLQVLGRTITLGSPNFLSSRAQFMSCPSIAHILLRNLSLTDPIMTRAPVGGPCCRKGGVGHLLVLLSERGHLFGL